MILRPEAMEKHGIHLMMAFSFEAQESVREHGEGTATKRKHSLPTPQMWCIAFVRHMHVCLIVGALQCVCRLPCCRVRADVQPRLDDFEGADEERKAVRRAAFGIKAVKAQAA